MKDDYRRTNSDPDLYEVDDLYFAAFLMLSGCEFVRKRKVGATKIVFTFRNAAGPIGDLRTDFYSGKAVGKLHDYSQKILAVKELLHD